MDIILSSAYCDRIGMVEPLKLKRFVHIVAAFALIVTACPCGQAFASITYAGQPTSAQEQMGPDCHPVSETTTTDNLKSCCIDPDVALNQKSANKDDIHNLEGIALAVYNDADVSNILVTAALPKIHPATAPPAALTPFMLGDLLLT